jgi:hypothetical protein
MTLNDTSLGAANQHARLAARSIRALPHRQSSVCESGVGTRMHYRAPRDSYEARRADSIIINDKAITLQLKRGLLGAI